MFSVGKLVAGAESYYVQSVARGREEYYTGSGEAPGYWTGEGAKAMGLQGKVDPDHLHAILSGRQPATGERLAEASPTKKVAGFDCTFSAPKSVSLLYGLTTEEIGNQVKDAHDQAVAAALGYLETHALHARRGHGGTELIGTDGFIAAAFRHRTSRAGDPQLHTHVLVANVIHGIDGKWSAPWARLLYVHGRTASFVYQAVLRRELAQRVGVTFTPVVGGIAEVAGVDREMMRAFSTRRNQIEARLANLGYDSPKAAQVAALETRAPKDPSIADALLGKGACPPRSLADTWRARAHELGHDPDGLIDICGPARDVEEAHVLVDEIADELVGSTVLTERLSTFSRRDVVRAVAERLPDGADYHVIDYTTQRILASAEIVALGRLGPGAEERLTTTEMLSVEDRLVDRCVAARGQGHAVVDADIVREAIASHPDLSDEQRDMIERLTTSGDRVQVVVGAAGTGKTSALSVAREVWESAAFRVLGAALAARAAGELQDGAGITSTTIAALDHAITTGQSRFTETDILVIDESAMVGTRMLARVVDHATQSGASVVLVGDHHQLPEIDTGGAFAGLARHLDAIQLTENRRQVNAWERDALGELRTGDVTRAVRALDDAGRTRHFDSMTQAKTALVSDWLASCNEEPNLTSRMYAVRRSDVDALNDEACKHLRSRSKLEADIFTAKSGMGFARGDEVLCTRNDRFLGVVNGTTGKVVSARAGVLTIQGPSGTFHLDEPYIAAGNVAYGYATTIHKSQGATVDRAFVLGTAGLYREAGYVALSRARQSSHLYVVDSGIETGLVRDPTVEAAHTSPGLEDNRSLVDTLSVSRAKTMARDELVAARSAPPHTTLARTGAMSPVLMVEQHRRMNEHARPADPPGYRPVKRSPNLAIWTAAQTDLSRPPRYIVDALGDRPTAERQRRQWAVAAHAIASYRERTGFDGETALGPSPAGSLAKMSYQRALNAIVSYRCQRDLENQRVREPRGRDVGLSL